MNKLTIIGNLTKDPELRTTTSGKNVCSFTVAVNRRRKAGEQAEADFFRVSAWDGKADVCAKYLSKGKKVCVVGSVGIHTYTNSKGETMASMEVTADDFEMLSPRSEPGRVDEQSGMTVVDSDECPY